MALATAEALIPAPQSLYFAGVAAEMPFCPNMLPGGQTHAAAASWQGVSLARSHCKAAHLEQWAHRAGDCRFEFCCSWRTSVATLSCRPV
jgi:hypothetical protein